MQQGATSVGVDSDLCGVLLVERWSEVGKGERLIGLACLIGTTDALCDALAIDGTKGADIEVGVARVDDELDVGCVGRESVLDSDIELSANALESDGLCRGAGIHGEWVERAESRFDAGSGECALVEGQSCGASADKGEVMAAVGEGESDSAEVVLVGCLVCELRSAVEDV